MRLTLCTWVGTYPIRYPPTGTKVDGYLDWYVDFSDIIAVILIDRFIINDTKIVVPLYMPYRL